MILFAIHIVGIFVQMKFTFPRWPNNESLITIGQRERIELKRWSFSLKTIGLYHRVKNPQGVLLYFHGNWSTLNDEKQLLQNLHRVLPDHSIMAAELPWYGQNSWIPLESSVYNTAQTYYNYLIQQWYSSENIIPVWYSIGSASAAYLWEHNKTNKVILISPLSSTYDMSKVIFGRIIQYMFLLSNSFNNVSRLQNYKGNLLIIHWNNDNTIPISLSKNIFNANRSKTKQFISVPWWDHSMIYNDWNVLKNISDFISIKRSYRIYP